MHGRPRPTSPGCVRDAATLSSRTWGCPRILDLPALISHLILSLRHPPGLRLQFLPPLSVFLTGGQTRPFPMPPAPPTPSSHPEVQSAGLLPTFLPDSPRAALLHHLATYQQSPRASLSVPWPWKAAFQPESGWAGLERLRSCCRSWAWGSRPGGIFSCHDPLLRVCVRYLIKCSQLA